MGFWDGLYENTKESKDDLSEDILRAGEGKFCYPGPSGETIRQTDTQIDVYGPSDGPKGHSHHRYNSETGKIYSRD